MSNGARWMILGGGMLVAACNLVQVKLQPETITQRNTFRFSSCGPYCRLGPLRVFHESFDGGVWVGQEYLMGKCNPNPPNPETCTVSDNALFRGIFRFDLSPLAGKTVATATLLFHTGSGETDPAAGQPFSCLLSMGSEKDSTSDGLPDFDKFANFMSGKAVYQDDGQVKIANSTNFSVEVTRQIQAALAAGQTSMSWVLAGIETLDTSGWSTKAICTYDSVLLDVYVRNP